MIPLVAGFLSRTPDGISWPTDVSAYLQEAVDDHVP
jgi:hypothetical protein